MDGPTKRKERLVYARILVETSATTMDVKSIPVRFDKGITTVVIEKEISTAYGPMGDGLVKRQQRVVAQVASTSSSDEDSRYDNDGIGSIAESFMAEGDD